MTRREKNEIQARVANEFADKIQKYIADELKKDCEAKANGLGGPNVQMAGEFIAYCEGKIAALKNVFDFVDEAVLDIEGAHYD